MEELRIGVVGYSHERFNHDLAPAWIKIAYERISCLYPHTERFAVVSGLTNMGIPALAYQEAADRGWRTVGVACNKAKDSQYPLYPVDESLFVGEEWGDESARFLSMCDVLARIGGGKQSYAEVAEFKKTRVGVVLEYELLLLPR